MLYGKKLKAFVSTVKPGEAQWKGLLLRVCNSGQMGKFITVR